MKITTTLILCLSTLLPAAQQQPEKTEFLLGGIQVNEPSHQAWLDALQKAKMNTVSITDYAHQGDWDSDKLWWDAENPGLLAELRAAKKRDMHAVLILRVALDHAFPRNRFLWHGMIMPKSDALIRSWFAKYTRFALKWAQTAQDEGADALLIGSEMNALASTLALSQAPVLESYYLNEQKQKQRRQQFLVHQETLPKQELEARIRAEQAWARQVTESGKASLQDLNRRRQLLQEEWTSLIAKIRKVYKGRLGYAANFDQYHEVGFWQDLELMGINAYFQLRQHWQPDLQAAELYPILQDGWSKVLADIQAFRSAQGLQEQPVIFSEMGYTFRANCTLQPWADHGCSLVQSPEHDKPQLMIWRQQPKHPLERALAVRALHAAHQELAKPFLQGILYWKLSTILSHPDIESFVLMLNGEPADPLLIELQRFL